MYKITYTFGGKSDYVKFCFSLQEVKEWEARNQFNVQIIKIEEYEPAKTSK